MTLPPHTTTVILFKNKKVMRIYDMVGRVIGVSQV
jgi:hypothetical protein